MKHRKHEERQEPHQEVAHEELLTVHEVANRLRVDETTVRRWITNGVLDAVILPHLGTRHGYRIRQSTLTTLLSTPVSRPTLNTEQLLSQG